MNKRIIAMALAAATLFSCTLPVLAEDKAAEVTEIPEKNFELTVATEEQQTYEGFGFCMPTVDFTGNVDAKSQETIAKLIYDDLNVNYQRCWLELPQFMVDEKTYSLSGILNRYEGTFMKTVRDRGIKILIAPSSNYPSFLGGKEVNPDTGEMANWSQIKPSSADVYALHLASAISELREKYKWPVAATGIYNEPGMPMVVMRLIIPALRKYLDNLGCEDVIIVAPELANNDANAFKALNQLISDETAIADVDAVGTHSYNMAWTKTTADILKSSGKTRFWQTESSTTGTDDGYGNAVTTAARYLNDLNHMCTEWMYFNSVSNYSGTGRQNGTGFAGWEASTKTMHFQEKYWYMKHISDTFKPGAVFYHTVDDNDGEIAFTYGVKKMIYTATAQNPDKTWSIGIVNATDSTQNAAWLADSDFKRNNRLQPDTIANVNLKVLGLSESGSQRFNVIKTSREGNLVEQEPIVAEDGVIKLRLNAGELLTLTSVNPIEKVEAVLEYEEYTEEVMVLPDKPADMSDFQYELWIQGSVVVNYDMSKLPEWTPTYETVVKKRLKGSGGGSVDKHLTTLLLGSPDVYVKGKKQQLDQNNPTVSPIVSDGMTYVPVRFVELLGGKASYDDETEELSISLNGFEIKTQKDKKDMYVNGSQKTAKGSIKQIGNRLYIPLRDIAESVGMTLKWDDRGLITLTDNTEMENIRYSLVDKFAKKLADKLAAANPPEEEPSKDDEAADETPSEEPEVKDERLVSTSGVDKNIVSLFVGNPLCFVKGKEHSFDQDNTTHPLILDGTAYVPIRFVEMLGGTAGFDDQNGKITLRLSNFNIEAVLGKTHMTVNGMHKQINGSPRKIGNTLYLPLRAISDNAGMTLYWDNSGLIVLTDNVESESTVQKLLEKFFPKTEAEDETDETAETAEAEE